jgi:hypothetical protein
MSEIILDAENSYLMCQRSGCNNVVVLDNYNGELSKVRCNECLGSDHQSDTKIVVVKNYAMPCQRRTCRNKIFIDYYNDDIHKIRCPECNGADHIPPNALVFISDEPCYVPCDNCNCYFNQYSINAQRYEILCPLCS